jgi:hypothetical protein
MGSCRLGTMMSNWGRAPLKSYVLATLVITLEQLSKIQFLKIARAVQAFLTCFITS